MNYALELFRDAALSERVERLSLSAPSDARALEQAEAMRWKCECAGESRVLVLSRDGVEVARMGSRRLARPAFSIGDEVEFGTLRHDRLAGVVTDVDCGRSGAYDIMVDRHPDTGEPCMWKHIDERSMRRVEPVPWSFTIEFDEEKAARDGIGGDKDVVVDDEAMSKWVVTVLVEDGRWVPVEVEAETMADALDYIYSLDWVENVVEFQRVE